VVTWMRVQARAGGGQREQASLTIREIVTLQFDGHGCGQVSTRAFSHDCDRRASSLEPGVHLGAFVQRDRKAALWGQGVVDEHNLGGPYTVASEFVTE